MEVRDLLRHRLVALPIPDCRPCREPDFSVAFVAAALRRAVLTRGLSPAKPRHSSKAWGLLGDLFASSARSVVYLLPRIGNSRPLTASASSAFKSPHHHSLAPDSTIWQGGFEVKGAMSQRPTTRAQSRTPDPGVPRPANRGVSAPRVTRHKSRTTLPPRSVTLFLIRRGSESRATIGSRGICFREFFAASKG